VRSIAKRLEAEKVDSQERPAWRAAGSNWKYAPAFRKDVAAMSEPQNEPPGLTLRRDDFGAFRALESGSNDLVVLRPQRKGLRVERRDGRELIPWDAIVGVTLTATAAGRAQVPTVSVEFASGAPLDFADALAPGADALPLTLGSGRNALLRVERCRMLTAVIASAAGLAPATINEFRRGERAIPVPELATRPRVLPRWAALFTLPVSVAAIVLLFQWRWTTAIAITLVLVVHELAHALAMRLLGVKVRGFVFIPLLGGATLTEHAFPSRWVEALVSLAGPASGLPTAGAIMLLFVTGRPEWIDDAALGIGVLWALGVNVLNLLPVLPLDGGRVAACLVAGLPQAPRTILTYAPLVVLSAAIAIFAPPEVRLAAFAFLFAAFAITRMTLRRLAVHTWMSALPQSADSVRAALRDVTHAMTGRAREDADGGVAPSPLSSGQAAVVLAVYVGEIVLLVTVAMLSGIFGVLDLR
jgi:Zn-dependent protease